MDALLIYKDRKFIGKHMLRAGELVLGRGGDVVLDSTTVPRRHAAIRRRAGKYFIVDLASANGTFVNGAPLPAAWVFLLAAMALTAASAFVAIRQPALFTGLLAFAAFCWGIGTALWIAGRSAPEIAGWWLAFLVLTIAAERLELSRLLAPRPWTQAVFLAAAAILIAGTWRGELGAAAAELGVGTELVAQLLHLPADRLPLLGVGRE